MSAINSNCLVFAGPTLVGAETRPTGPGDGIEVLPPVRRGDIETLVATSTPGVIAIVDGFFHQCLSVGHAEIRSAVAAGWQVWGLSSMGAIRAYEMRDLGVRGYGRVYELFDQFEDFRDDEVALTHEPGPSYRALSEPLVHIRFWLRELVKMNLLMKRQEKRLIGHLMRLWYGDRTLARVRSMVVGLIPDRVDEVDNSLANFDRFRVKCHDLNDFLQERPWTSQSLRNTALSGHIVSASL
jgi:hypothetical protein